nr:DUF2163 domain-containing protein [Roseomonas sp. GC11]
MQAEMSGEVARLTRCIVVRRADGVVMGFTGHDEPVPVVGVVCEPGTAITPSNVEDTNALSADNSELTGTLTSDAITEEDIAAGLYANALVEDYTVCWADPSIAPVENGYARIGEIRISGDQFVFGLLGPQEQLSKTVGRSCTVECPWRLGDAKCRVDLAPLTHEATVDGTDGMQALTAGALAAHPADHFAYGTVEWLSGKCKGTRRQVKASANGRLVLWQSTPREIEPGDTVRVVAGCGGSFESDCKARFNNGRRFGGFPWVPSREQLQKTPNVKAS